MLNNKYIRKIHEYVKLNTPINFIFQEEKYDEIKKHIEKENLDKDNLDLLCACYSLFYTALSYHKKASGEKTYQPYFILLGDYISSYVAELLYKNQQIDILKVFTISTKEIMLNILENKNEDPLLNNIIEAIKSR